MWSSALIGVAVGGAIAYTVGFRQGHHRALRSLSPVESPLPPSAPVESPAPTPPPPAIEPSTVSLKSEKEQNQEHNGDQEIWKLAYYRVLQSEQFKSGFLARTAHELRSPLSSAVGLHQLILSDLCEDRDEEREFIQQANEAVLKWVDLLDHLIDVSKATYGSVAANLQTISVDKLFGEVQRLIELQAANRNLRLTIMIPDAPCLGIGDPKRLSQALVDLGEAVISLLAERGQGGALQLSAGQSESQLMIYLDSTCPLDLWQEAVELLDGPDPLAPMVAAEPCREKILPAIAPPPFTSPTLALRLAHLLVESMGGHLTVQDLQAEGLATGDQLISRFAITLPTNLD